MAGAVPQDQAQIQMWQAMQQLQLQMQQMQQMNPITAHSLVTGTPVFDRTTVSAESDEQTLTFLRTPTNGLSSNTSRLAHLRELVISDVTLQHR